ncbi:MAG TPA: 1,2-phenylacetyl-CoA epoxidase subunit PaaD [Gemmatimonadales bacterium]|nr:1,2-phenylacetyl-CoA epoxidase subunit PaaD [Gemmatimonadales bacterium]
MTEAGVLGLLDQVKDPEVPVISIVELGIVRGVQLEGSEVTVVITPTYSGCPAMRAIEDEIRAVLAQAGFARVRIETVYAPAWTTDWIKEDAREKLRAYGIAPPGAVVSLDPTRRAGPRCPFCGSTETGVVSEFGATACKSLHICRACRQPFEHFKAF